MRRALAILILAVLSTSTAYADDVGRASDVRTLRHDVPILLSRLRGSFEVTDVVVLRDEAIAIWTMKTADGATSRGLTTLQRKNDRWWDVGEILPEGVVLDRSATGEIVSHPYRWVRSAPGFRGGCDSTSAGALEAESKGLDRATLSEMPISSELVDLAAQHVPTINNDSLATPYPFANGIGCDMYQIPQPSTLINIIDGYQTDLFLPFNAKRVTFSQRAPTAAEMPPARGARAYYFFTLTSMDDESDFSFPDSWRLQVWCPFVLDSHINYRLNLSGTTIGLTPIPLDLKDNILGANIPRLIVTAGHAFDGEIDGP